MVMPGTNVGATGKMEQAIKKGTDTMKWNKKYTYPTSVRSLINGKRHYSIDNRKLPSVTTILSATQSDEKRQSLANWRAREGATRANKIMNEAAVRGTSMHTYLEAYVKGTGHLDLTQTGLQANVMAQQIIEKGLGDLEEVWGQEVTLYYPDLYAGATDLVGIYNGAESIVDYKQTNKPKRREWIEDYFVQLAAYAMAHNQVYDTKIQSGIILMCSKDNLFQKFEVSGREFQKYKHQFLRKIDQYYKIVSGSKGCADTKNDE